MIWRAPSASRRSPLLSLNFSGLFHLCGTRPDCSIAVFVRDDGLCRYALFSAKISESTAAFGESLQKRRRLPDFAVLAMKPGNPLIYLL